MQDDPAKATTRPQAPALEEVWLADWSDEEDAAFRRAWGDRPPQVLRCSPLGTTVGSRLHRLRSYPAYVGLAVRGLRGCPPSGVLVAWQPLAGAVVGMLRRRAGPALVVLNPLLTDDDRSVRARLLLAGVRRADRVVVYSRVAAEALVGRGVEPARVRVIRLGVQPRPEVPEPDAEAPLLAAGRDHRDWDVLAQAAAQAGVRVLVAGPSAVPAPLELVRPADRAAFQHLVASARAVVVPLLDARRQAGTLAVLDAVAAGRPVIATSGPGTQDYVRPDAGRLVTAGDPAELAAALRDTADPAQLATWAAGARAARAELSLDHFTRAVGALAQEARAEGRPPR